MNTNRSVRVKDIVEKFQMEVINKGTDYDTEIYTCEVVGSVRCV